MRVWKLIALSMVVFCLAFIPIAGSAASKDTIVYGTTEKVSDMDTAKKAAEVLDELLPRYLVTRLYQSALESVASFFSSQMVAMKNATDNADELIDDLTLSYNKARQANITGELIEIASGTRAR